MVEYGVLNECAQLVYKVVFLANTGKCRLLADGDHSGKFSDQKAGNSQVGFWQYCDGLETQNLWDRSVQKQGKPFRGLSPKI